MITYSPDRTRWVITDDAGTTLGRLAPAGARPGSGSVFLGLNADPARVAKFLETGEGWTVAKPKAEAKGTRLMPLEEQVAEALDRKPPQGLPGEVQNMTEFWDAENQGRR